MAVTKFNGIQQINTDEAPRAIGPYCQAVRAGDFLFISGQLAIDPQTGALIGTTIEEQTEVVLNNIEAILRAAGLTLAQVVRAEIYVSDLNYMKAVNGIYAQRFSHAIKPARHAFQVTRLPLDALIEITCIAYVDHLNFC